MNCILSCRARSVERRLELLHDVVSIRSDRSRRRPRSGQTVAPPRKTVWQRFKEVFRTVIAFVFSNVGICVLVLGYLILGRFNWKETPRPLTQHTWHVFQRVDKPCKCGLLSADACKLYPPGEPSLCLLYQTGHSVEMMLTPYIQSPGKWIQRILLLRLPSFFYSSRQLKYMSENSHRNLSSRLRVKI